MRIPPVALVFGIAKPLVGDANPADESDPAVNHEQFAVRAVIHAPGLIPAQRMLEAVSTISSVAPGVIVAQSKARRAQFSLAK